MPGAHPFIQQVVGRCLDSNPAKRPASVEHVASVLSRAARLGTPLNPAPKTDTPHQDAILPRFAWSMVGSSLAGGVLTLLLAPWSTGIGLTFDTKGPDGSLAHAFTWLWCLALQLFVTIGAMAAVIKMQSKTTT